MPKYSIIYTAHNEVENFVQHILPALRNQTEQDFEVIVGDDGSTDGLEARLKRFSGMDHGVSPICYVRQENEGYGYTSIVNKAVSCSLGDYLVFLSGDTFPSDTFLEELGRALKKDRVVTGKRRNVLREGDTWHVQSEDWRLTKPFIPFQAEVLIENGVEIFAVHHMDEEPWRMMTMNTLACHRSTWNKVQGLTPCYNGGYGKMDWSFCMKALYSGCELWWNVAAIAYHIDNGKPGREDTPANTEAFEKELAEWRKK